MHVPVPADRHDRAYFAPLASLIRGDNMDLYLGVVQRQRRSRRHSSTHESSQRSHTQLRYRQ